MQKFEFLRQPLLGELAMSRKKRERKREKMPFIVATCVYASSQGQRTHSARTKLEKINGVPVLFLGIASLVLNDCEINIIDNHYKETLSSLLKLYSGTPKAFIYFMSGILPGKAILHQRQLRSNCQIKVHVCVVGGPLPHAHKSFNLVTHPPIKRSESISWSCLQHHRLFCQFVLVCERGHKGVPNRFIS